MSPSAALANRSSQEALDQLEKVVIEGNLATLTPAERVGYYARVCESVGLNPLTRPFEYLTLNGRLILYARKDATDQLRKVNGISIDRLDHQQVGDLASVTAYGHDRSGRTDSALGAVNIKGLVGEALANALMKAETKAKRRLTLSLAGLGWLDESEVGAVDETPAGTVVTSRAEAVAARAAALPAIEQAEGQEPAANRSGPQPSQDTVLDVDQVPFESGPDSAMSTDDWWFRRIHALGAERGLTHDALHNLAVTRFGVESMTGLSVIQREQMLTHVEGLPIDPAEAPGSADIETAVESPEPPPPEPAVTPPTRTSRRKAAIESPVESVGGASADTPGQGSAPALWAKAPPAASVGTPLGIEAYTIYAAAALGIGDLAGWEVGELNAAEHEHVISTMALDDYDAWFASCSRELRAVLRNAQMSPRQRADRSKAA